MLHKSLKDTTEALEKVRSEVGAAGYPPRWWCRAVCSFAALASAANLPAASPAPALQHTFI